MRRPPFAWFLAVAFALSVLVAWLPIRLGGVHGYQNVALALSLAWLGLFALGLALYRRRAVWLLVTAPPALFWLVLIGFALVCDGRCG